MRLVVTGGGTGGHVYPALEVARLAVSHGVEVHYFGSSRGQEVLACRKAGIDFQGFGSAPLYSLRTLRGWKGLASLFLSQSPARRALTRLKPDVVFATGGYSSGPILSGARSLGIPYVLHEQNAVPGRSNRLFAKGAACVATTFRSAASQFEGCKVERTGLPIRKELRDLADGPAEKDLLPLVLVVGGSQGAQALNEAALGAAARMTGKALNWLHLTGKLHFEGVFETFEKLGLTGTYEVRPYLEGPEMASAYARATLATCRGGAGTLAELAAFRLPSVIVPYPLAHAAHQLHNAREFESMDSATVVEQPELRPSSLEAALCSWLDDPDRRDRAGRALAEWDVPDASSRILKLLGKAAGADGG